MTTPVSGRFLRLSGATSAISAVTTLGLIFLSRGFTPAVDPVVAVERAADPAPVMAALYPLLQPPARCLTGVWLWREAGRNAA